MIFLTIIIMLFWFGLCIMSIEQHIYTFDDVIRTYNELSLQNESEKIKCLKTHINDYYCCIRVNGDITGLHQFISNVFARYLSIQGKTKFYVGTKKILSHDKIPEDITDLLQFFYLACKCYKYEDALLQKILEDIKMTNMSFSKIHSDTIVTLLENLFQNNVKFLLFNNCSFNTNDFSLLHKFIVTSRLTDSISSKCMLLIFALKFSSKENKKLWLDFNFINRVKEYLLTTDTFKIFLNQYTIQRKLIKNAYEYMINCDECLIYKDQENKKKSLKTMDISNNHKINCKNELSLNYLICLEDKTKECCKDKIEKNLQNSQFFEMNFYRHEENFTLFFVVNKYELPDLPKKIKECQYCVSVYKKESKNVCLWFRFLYFLVENEKFEIPSPLNFSKSNRSEFYEGQNCVYKFLYILKNSFMNQDFMSPNSTLPTCKFNFDGINYLYWKQTPQIDISINKQNNTYESFCNLYYGLKSNSFVNLEIDINTAVFKFKTNFQCKKGFFKRTFDCFIVIRKIEISDINKYNFKKYNSLILCLKYKNQNIIQYYYICIPVLDQKNLKIITYIKQFKHNLPIKFDMLHLNQPNARLRAEAKIVIDDFIPKHLHYLLALNRFKKPKFIKNLVPRIYICMIRCMIKYDTFLRVNYEKYNKLEAFQWAEGLDNDSNIFINKEFLKLLIEHEESLEFSAARDIILQNLKDIFYKYIKKQSKFLKDSNEDVIILQRGEYHFKNDQTKNIQELIKHNYK